MKQRIFKCADQKEANAAQVGPPSLKDPHSRQYAIQTLALIKRIWDSKKAYEHEFEEALERAEKYQIWVPLKYASIDDMLQAEIGTDKQSAREKVQARAAEARRDGAMPKKEYGEGKPGPGRGNKTDADGNRFGSNQASYLCRRLLRDAPDIFTALESGAYPSVRQAAIAAGIVKVPTPLQIAQKAFEKLSAKDRNVFLQYYDLQYKERTDD